MYTRTIPYIDPLRVAEFFSGEDYCVLLDSADKTEQHCISYFAFQPFCLIEDKAGSVFLNGKSANLSLLDLLQQQLALYSDHTPTPLPFSGGAIGYFGYELGADFEQLPEPKNDELGIPRSVIGLYDVIIAFDHKLEKVFILSSGFPLLLPSARCLRAEQRALEVEDKLRHLSAPLSAIDWTIEAPWQAEFSPHQAIARINTVIDYIYAGDIFQANFSQRYVAKRPAGLSDWNLYRRLRYLSPAPFAAFMRLKDMSILSASPERFLNLSEKGLVSAQPIKGTRARHSEQDKDEILAKDLTESAKDHAENLMIVDLMRNDLARVSVVGSVAVPELCKLESFASVHHLISTIVGRLREAEDACSLLQATFPGGSVTGAPKIRAMEIIHELEGGPRGAYCGCLGWIGFNGAMDMSMIIRTLTLTEDKIVAQAGGGIVAYSDAALEYEESMTKIAPLLRALSSQQP